MTNIPDYRGRIEGDRPQDFLHKLAGIIPGYTGYQDRERRREADKELRMFLARRFREQHAALGRVQQQLARNRHLEFISEVDRLAGVLQRFIDKLETATQGYAGLFDPVKVDTPQLDQLYTFDAALANGLADVTESIAAVSAATQQGTGPAPGATTTPTLPTALTNLSTVLDNLLMTWNHRSEVIVSGQPVSPEAFDRFRAAQAPGVPTAPLGQAPGPGEYGNIAPQGAQPQGSAASAPSILGQAAPGGPPPPQPPGTLDPGATQRMDSPSNVSGPPTGGPADRNPWEDGGQ